MRTDKLAYLWFRQIPKGFFTLIGRTEINSENYTFKSVELKETAFRLDAVFEPLGDEEYTFFVEVQFQRDEAFYARFFAEIFLYIKQFPVKRWHAVVIYPSRRAEQENLSAFEELLSTRLIKRIYMDELSDIARLDPSVAIFKLLVEPSATATATAKALLERAPEYLDFIERVLFYKFPSLTRKEILKMLSLQEEFEEELKKTRAFQEILEEGLQEGLQKGLQQGLQQGLQEGLQKGLQQGEEKGKLASVPLLRKLGMSDEDIARELNLSLEKVKSV